MNLDNVSKDIDRTIIDSILETVTKQFCGNECKIWLSGVSRDDAEKAASSLRTDKPALELFGRRSRSKWCLSCD
jgi:hypothetical protein